MVRTRFAPSPTGALHPGNVRIAVLNWLFARQQGGAFLLRIEDTDVERRVEGAEEAIFADLRWLGLDWDEGPSWQGAPPPGRHAPYRQSERGPSYGAVAARLRDGGHAYPCYCTFEQIEERRAAAIAAGRAPLDDPCAGLVPDEAARLRAEGRAAALRFRVPRPYVDAERTPIDSELLPLAVEGIRSHLSTFSEIDEHLAAYFPSEGGGEPAVAEAGSARVLEAASAALANVHDWSQRALEAALSAAAASAGMKGRAFYEPLRLALTGRPHGPPFTTLLRVQGRARVLAALVRARRAAACASGAEGG